MNNNKNETGQFPNAKQQMDTEIVSLVDYYYARNKQHYLDYARLFTSTPYSAEKQITKPNLQDLKKRLKLLWRIFPDKLTESELAEPAVVVALALGDGVFKTASESITQHQKRIQKALSKARKIIKKKLKPDIATAAIPKQIEAPPESKPEYKIPKELQGTYDQFNQFLTDYNINTQIKPKQFVEAYNFFNTTEVHQFFKPEAIFLIIACKKNFYAKSQLGHETIIHNFLSQNQWKRNFQNLEIDKMILYTENGINHFNITINNQTPTAG